MSNLIVPEDVKKLVKEIVAYRGANKEYSDDMLERLYAEILPEGYYEEEIEDDSSWKIEINL